MAIPNRYAHQADIFEQMALPCTYADHIEPVTK